MNQAAAGALVVRCLGEADLGLMDDLLTLFGDAFNEPAIALYDGLGEQEEVLHFDIRVLP
jgi:hypothetical protein